MRKIYLVRHGIPELEGKLSRCIGRYDCPLSETQISVLTELKNYLSDKSISTIYTSPLKRCRRTAEILSDNLIPVIPVPDLTEIDMGTWENMTFSDIQKEYPEAYGRRIKELAAFEDNQGERFVDCQNRTVCTFGAIVKETTENIVIVTHIGVIRCILCAITKTNLNDALTFTVPYGGAVVLRLTDENTADKLESWDICGLNGTLLQNY